MKIDEREAAIDACYRSLANAIIIQAVRDTTDPRQSQEATDFLTSPQCKSLLRLAGLQWTATGADIPQAVMKLKGRRRRHLANTAKRRMRAIPSSKSSMRPREPV